MCLTFSDPSSASAWHSRARKDLGSLQSVVLVVRKTVPPTLSLTHWLRGVSSWPGPPCCPAPAISLLAVRSRQSHNSPRSPGYRIQNSARCRYSNTLSLRPALLAVRLTDQSSVKTVLSLSAFLPPLLSSLLPLLTCIRFWSQV